jgi:hypothetical protein
MSQENMNNFEKQLLRLKQALAVSADQEVAALLGLTKAAFSDRKVRDAFPEDKLLALSARRPELGLNVDYVLTGKWPEDVQRHVDHAAAVTTAMQDQTEARIAQAVALFHACTCNELDTLVKGVLAMGNEMMRQRGFRMPGITTWHPNDAPPVKTSKKKTV